jgi:hypothetical protein
MGYTNVPRLIISFRFIYRDVYPTSGFCFYAKGPIGSLIPGQGMKSLLLRVRDL